MRYHPDFELNAGFISSGHLTTVRQRNKSLRGAGLRPARSRIVLFLLLVAASLSGGCGPSILGQSFPSSTVEGGQESADAGLQKVNSLRKQSIRFRAGHRRAKRAEEEAATRYLVAGTEARFAGNLDEAVRLFELGLSAQPANLALNEARAATLKRKEVLRLSANAKRARVAGDTGLAQALYRKAEFIDTGNATVLAALRDMDLEAERRGENYAIKAFESRAPMELNFRGAKLKDALLVIAKPYNLNFVFDPTVGDVEVSVSARQLNFYQALNLLLQSGDCFYKVIGQNSILVAKNDKKKKYTDLYFKTFYLQTVRAEKMAEILASSMELKTVIPDKTLNTVQIRANRETLKIAERVIAVHDSARAQIVLDVEVLEVDRTKSRELGIDYGSQITAQIPQTSPRSIQGPARYSMPQPLQYPQPRSTTSRTT